MSFSRAQKISEILGLSASESVENFELGVKVIPGSDSYWGLCADDGLVVNIFEHRVGVSVRQTEVMLVLGGFTLMGQLGDVTAGPITLTNPAASMVNFIGNLAVDFANDQVTLDGILYNSGESILINRTLNCSEKSGRIN